jgi:hypothetical protein
MQLELLKMLQEKLLIKQKMQVKKVNDISIKNFIYILVLAVQGVKGAANTLADKTQSAVQGAGRKGKEAATAAGKETSNFASKIRKSIEDVFK